MVALERAGQSARVHHTRPRSSVAQRAQHGDKLGAGDVRDRARARVLAGPGCTAAFMAAPIVRVRVPQLARTGVRARLQPAEVVARSAGGVRARERVAVRFEQAHRG